MENNIKPKHIAIIMDGNRRWAKEHNLDRALGHKKGAEVLETIAKYCNKIGIEALTVYAFSTENWKRSEDEVNALMSLLETYLDDFAKEADTENIVIRVLGNVSAFSKSFNLSKLKYSTFSSKERIAFIIPAPKFGAIAITSPVAFICVPKSLLAVRNFLNGHFGIFTTA